MAKSIEELIEDTVRLSRIQDQYVPYAQQPQASTSAVTLESRPSPTPLPAPTSSANRSLARQSATSFTHLLDDDNPSEPRRSPSPSNAGSITTLTPSGKASKKAISAKGKASKVTPSKTVSPQSSLNLPTLHYPAESRLIPNTSGTKESAATTRYRSDSNDLRLEGMIRTESSTASNLIRNLNDSLHQHDETYDHAQQSLGQDVTALRTDVNDLQTRVHDIESSQPPYDAILQRLDQLEQQPPGPSGQLLSYTRASSPGSSSPPTTHNTPDRPLWGTSDIFSNPRNPDSDFDSPCHGSQRQPSASPQDRSPSPSPHMASDTPPSVAPQNPVPLRNRISRRPASPSFMEPTSKRRRTGTPSSTPSTNHNTFPGSTVRISTETWKFRGKGRALRAFFHTWFDLLDNAATPLTFPYRIRHTGPARRQVRLFFTNASQALAFVNAWDSHRSRIVNNAAFNVSYQSPSE